MQMEIDNDLRLLLEKSNRQRKRQERYFHEKDKENRVVYYGSEDKLAYLLYDSGYYNDGKSEYELLCESALKMALADFAERYPGGYRVIIEFYYHGEITYTELGRRLGISRQAATKTLKSSIRRLRPLVELYIQKLTVQ